MKTNFDTYLRYEELAQTLHALAEEYPGLCKLASIGQSYEGREIWLAELTNQEAGPAESKPAFWVDGNTHAGEVTGSMAALYLIEHLLENYGSEDLVRRLLDEQAFYVLPRLSPDGAERYLTTPYTLRATVRPWPEPEEEPGLHPEDVDGDGNILQMRVEDPRRTPGSWSPAPPTKPTREPRTTGSTGKGPSRTTTASGGR
jgi:murein tripeptide amidase MpaA